MLNMAFVFGVFLSLCFHTGFVLGASLDLSHPLGNDTLSWPGVKNFQFTILSRGLTPDGYWYEANSIATVEHVGTHMDAPAHFNKDGWPVNEIPLDNLIRPVVVIDISAKAEQDPDTILTVEDIQAWETQYGQIPNGGIVLLNCGWEQYYPDNIKKYFGNDVQNASDFHFPGFGPEAAKWLVTNREIVGVGLDTPSTDHGPSLTYDVHVILCGNNVYGLENMRNIGRLPITGATLYVMPMKIAGGSGGPTRITAVWDTDTDKVTCGDSVNQISALLMVLGLLSWRAFQ